MSRPPIPIDRVRLDRHVLTPRSCLLELGPGPSLALKDHSWWVFLAGARLPEDVAEGDQPLEFQGFTVDGRVLSGRVVIVSREDGARGTRLILAGEGSIPGSAGPADPAVRPSP